MRILTVSPGPKFSTYDTFMYYHRAFESIGHETFAFKYHDHFAYHATALSYMEGKSGDEEELQIRAIGLASESLISRIARVRPDLVFIISGIALPVQVWDWLDSFKSSLSKPFETMVLFTESPYIEETQAPLIGRVDIAGTMDRSSLDMFKGINDRSVYVQHAYCNAVHYIQPVSIRHAADVFMVGTGFPERIRLLSKVDWSNVDFRIFGGNWGDIQESKAIEEFYNLDFLDNSTDVAKYYSNSRISLNIFRTAKWPGENVLHIDPDEAYSISPRCYEIMGCGGFLLTDIRPELDELFDVGKDLVVFDGAEDLGDKVHYYLRHDNERNRIAMSGYRAVREHTYEDRARKIIDFVSDT